MAALKARDLFDVWADLSYAHYQWEAGTIDSTEFNETLNILLTELRKFADADR